MADINKEIGNRIRIYRKFRSMTQEELAQKILKSKATISKYEKGEIAFDIQTLYDIADILSLNIEQLLWYDPRPKKSAINKNIPAFFQGVNRFYGYIYDGRNDSLLRCVFDILNQTEEGAYKIMMYMNYTDIEHYQICENTYYGFMEHWDSLTTILITNQHLAMEKATIQILASSLDYNEKMGLWTGLSTRPLMPVSTKILLSNSLIKEDKELIEKLKVSKEDIKNMKRYNMFPVM